MGLADWVIDYSCFGLSIFTVFNIRVLVRFCFPDGRMDGRTVTMCENHDHLFGRGLYSSDSKITNTLYKPVSIPIDFPLHVPTHNVLALSVQGICDLQTNLAGWGRNCAGVAIPVFFANSPVVCVGQANKISHSVVDRSDVFAHVRFPQNVQYGKTIHHPKVLHIFIQILKILIVLLLNRFSSIKLDVYDLI